MGLFLVLSGDQTNVTSISSVQDSNGQTNTLNSQASNVRSSNSGSSNSGSYAILKRRRRRNLQKLLSIFKNPSLIQHSR